MNCWAEATRGGRHASDAEALTVEKGGHWYPRCPECGDACPWQQMFNFGAHEGCFYAERAINAADADYLDDAYDRDKDDGITEEYTDGEH